MKAKISGGKSFSGLFRYLFDHGAPRLIGGNAAGDNAKDLTREFTAIRRRRLDVVKPVWHCSLSLPVGDVLTDKQWQRIAEDYLQRMGIDVVQHQWAMIRHSDHDYDHVHLVVNRIGLDKTLWYAQQDVFKAIKITRQMEQEYEELTDTSAKDNTDKKIRLTHAEQKHEETTGETAVRSVIAGHIRAVLDRAAKHGERLTPEQFIRQLRMNSAMGITVQCNIASTGKVNGFSFRMYDRSFTGSKVKAKWGELLKELDYESERDNQFLRTLAPAQISARPKTWTSTGILAGGKEPKAAQSVRIVKNPVLVKKRKSVIDDDVLHHNRRRFRALENEDESIKTHEQQQPKEPEAPMLQDEQPEQEQQQEPELNDYDTDDWER